MEVIIGRGLSAEVKAYSEWLGPQSPTVQEAAAVIYFFKKRRNMFRKFNDSYFELNERDRNYSVKLKFELPELTKQNQPPMGGDKEEIWK